jgi:ABC-type transport system involved in Fe-S cluster assembly fused permease/ATPase subunit
MLTPAWRQRDHSYSQLPYWWWIPWMCWQMLTGYGVSLVSINILKRTCTRRERERERETSKRKLKNTAQINFLRNIMLPVSVCLSVSMPICSVWPQYNTWYLQAVSACTTLYCACTLYSQYWLAARTRHVTGRRGQMKTVEALSTEAMQSVPQESDIVLRYI